MKTEIMAPVGSYESLAAAINARADSIYFGVGALNMRAHAAKKFTIDDLKKIVDTCKSANVKTYLTVNTVIYDEDIEDMQKLCDKAKETGVTAVIVTDIAAMQYARSIGLSIHASTQLNISNIEAVKYFSKYVDVIVLARELSLEQIKNITTQIKKQDIKGPNNEQIKIEVFVHGALCVSISGKCYMSLAQYAKSANRGECLHSCRRAYIVKDEETGDELKIENKYVMSPKDLCTITMVDKLIDAGISVFKIEGRGRPPEYVDTVVRTYKTAVEAVENKTYNKTKAEEWHKQLESVFNRGFWENGYYLGKKLGEWHDTPSSKATMEKQFIGKVKNYYVEPGIAELEIQANEIKINDEMIIIGPTSGVIKTKVDKILDEKDKEINSAEKGRTITIAVPEKVRKNDQVYILKKRT